MPGDGPHDVLHEVGLVCAHRGETKVGIPQVKRPVPVAQLVKDDFELGGICLPEVLEIEGEVPQARVVKMEQGAVGAFLLRMVQAQLGQQPAHALDLAVALEGEADVPVVGLIAVRRQGDEEHQFQGGVWKPLAPLTDHRRLETGLPVSVVLQQKARRADVESALAVESHEVTVIVRHDHVGALAVESCHLACRTSHVTQRLFEESRFPVFRHDEDFLAFLVLGDPLPPPLGEVLGVGIHAADAPALGREPDVLVPVIDDGLQGILAG